MGPSPADEATARARVIESASGARFGLLPARVEVKNGGAYQAASVILQAKEGSWHRHLALFDGFLGLRWLDAVGPRKVTWRAAKRRGPEDALAALVSPEQCDGVLTWLVSLDVAEPLLHMDSHLRTLLPMDVSKCADLPGGATLQRCRERLARRAYVGAAHFASDVRAVHATVLSLCARTPPAGWRTDGGVESRKGGDLEVVLHAAQVFVSAFETKWAEVLEALGEATRDRDAAASAVAAHWRAQRAVDHAAIGRVAVDANCDLMPTKEAALGKRVEVYWDGDDEWFAGLLSKYRDKDAKHFCEYDDGTAEWLKLADHGVRFLKDDDAAASSAVSAKASNATSPRSNAESSTADTEAGFSCQKLGKLVWAKSGDYPWWPGEICLLAVGELRGAFPPKGPSAATAKSMVLYFGETQFDMLESDTNVAPFNPLKPRERVKGKGDADLKAAIKLAIARSKALSIPMAAVTGPPPTPS